jgi:hypothetical protein
MFWGFLAPAEAGLCFASVGIMLFFFAVVGWETHGTGRMDEYVLGFRPRRPCTPSHYPERICTVSVITLGTITTDTQNVLNALSQLGTDQGALPALIAANTAAANALAAGDAAVQADIDGANAALAQLTADVAAYESQTPSAPAAVPAPTATIVAALKSHIDVVTAKAATGGSSVSVKPGSGQVQHEHA